MVLIRGQAPSIVVDLPTNPKTPSNPSAAWYGTTGINYIADLSAVSTINYLWSTGCYYIETGTKWLACFRQRFPIFLNDNLGILSKFTEVYSWKCSQQWISWWINVTYVTKHPLHQWCPSPLMRICISRHHCVRSKISQHTARKLQPLIILCRRHFHT